MLGSGSLTALPLAAGLNLYEHTTHQNIQHHAYTRAFWEDQYACMPCIIVRERNDTTRMQDLQVTEKRRARFNISQIYDPLQKI